MSTSAPAFPPAAARVGREHGPFTIDGLARTLRGPPFGSAFWVGAADSLHPVVGITLVRVRTGDGGPETSTAGAYGLVLRLGGTSPPGAAEKASFQAPFLAAEDRYRTVLQAIPRGRLDGSRAIAGTEVQVLVEMGEDWIRRGSRPPDDTEEATPKP